VVEQVEDQLTQAQAQQVDLGLLLFLIWALNVAQAEQLLM
jgi:hypothetical protein